MKIPIKFIESISNVPVRIVVPYPITGPTMTHDWVDTIIWKGKNEHR